MKAMILAAGRGTRMGELTENTPKALLMLDDKPLIAYRIEALARAGIQEIVINTHYFADQIRDTLGDGSHFGCHLIYSHETAVLETAGGVIQALPLLGDAPFIIGSCDTITDFDFNYLREFKLVENTLGHLILTENPPHHPQGDYGLDARETRVGLLKTRVSDASHPAPRLQCWNYAGFGVLHPKLFLGYTPGYRKLSEVFEAAIQKKQLTGEVYRGQWRNADTPERLNAL